MLLAVVLRFGEGGVARMSSPLRIAVERGEITVGIGRRGLCDEAGLFVALDRASSR